MIKVVGLPKLNDKDRKVTPYFVTSFKVVESHLSSSKNMGVKSDTILHVKHIPTEVPRVSPVKRIARLEDSHRLLHLEHRSPGNFTRGHFDVQDCFFFRYGAFKHGMSGIHCC